MPATTVSLLTLGVLAGEFVGRFYDDKGVGLWVVELLVAAVVGLTVPRFVMASRRIREALTDIERKREQVWSPQIEDERTQLVKVIDEISVATNIQISDPASVGRASVSEGQSTLYLRGLQLENIRCFQHFDLSLEDSNGPCFTTILLGDNAAGKTTVLRSIAVGLCPESDAIALMKTLPGSFLRDGTAQGSIQLYLRSADRQFEGSIRTTIEQPPNGGQLIRQITEPPDFPWERIFVCGYGTQRVSGRPTSHERYDAREAVVTLFSDSADLLNPEVVLLRRDPATRRRLEQILRQVLLLEDEKSGIRSSGRGIELGGPWGTQPLAAVSDGYRSTVQWVLDYLGWQIFANRLKNPSLSGMLLIDELEQHLHPRWQRYFVQRLRSQLGETQIIATSHTPLLAAGVADVPRSQVIRLVPTSDGVVVALKIPAEDLNGKRADQILADAFGLVTSKSPGSVTKVERYTELVSRARTQAEDGELRELTKELEDSWSPGDHALQRAADRAVSKVLDEMIDEGVNNLNPLVKQRLSDLFGPTKAR